MKLLKMLAFLPILTFNFLYCYPETHIFSPDEFLTQYFWREVITLSPPERPRIVLVLSGGGARGLAHIGVLKVLKEEGVPIDAIVGCSVGALVGALYCAGMEIARLERISQEIGWSDLTNISPPSIIGMLLREKQLSTEKMENYIKEHIGNKQFHELKIPFATVATDIKTGEKIIFQSGDVATAARASATIPGVFSPVEYRHRYLVDGGLIDNIPVDLAKLFDADIIIAVDISADYTKYSTSNMMFVLNQSIYIQGSLLSRASLQEADIVINPHVSDVAAFELWRAKECIDAGIIATQLVIPKLKKEIMDRTFKWLVIHN
ncbi:MAG: patatin-like phospholipase family protein [Elusimicrobiota bacterium]|nr:patatin-like phospholipase family protein [Elusimicrobiota bacterium]